MKGVNEGFFDDFYLKLCAAFEDKFLGLGRQLEAEKKGKCQDILRTYSQSAHQKIEEFKIIELKKKQGQPDLDMACDDNIRYSQEFINIHGVMVEKPFVYKKTYVEVRGENRSDMVGHKLTGLARLYGAQYESLYISMAVEDFYWAQFQYESGNKKESCEFLLDAFSYINSCVSHYDSTESPEYHRFRVDFDKACKKMNSSIGGRNKLKDLDYLKDVMATFLKGVAPICRYKYKSEALEKVTIHLCQYDQKKNPNKWDNDKGERENTIRNRVSKWAKTDLKVSFNNYINDKSKYKV
ncbi:hypothetical protein [Escherichia coli]|uniref:hypothetical protein n=2 Tax=Escherichia coli TaxID=562 RepID=UPI0006A5E70C|nr:hypothetical protein [Escherichia coli]EES0675259.1 hypothetical protein [Escherichia coli]EEZ2197580.1 hypothetical protein [Escherichia coli]EFS2097964.1 hypothetical protein [Escherichia coli]EGH1332467.1 hypothetical protein [Escherichia coli]EGH1367652.1 hypothetical protein [Escherichia coli]